MIKCQDTDFEFYYHQNDRALTWSQAQSFCLQHSADLATPFDTLGIQNRCLAKFRSPNIRRYGWIGVYRPNAKTDLTASSFQFIRTKFRITTVIERTYFSRDNSFPQENSCVSVRQKLQLPTKQALG